MIVETRSYIFRCILSVVADLSYQMTALNSQYGV